MQMAVENPEDRLNEFTGMTLFQAATRFDSWCTYLCETQRSLRDDYAHARYTETIDNATTETCTAFNLLADVIMNDHEIGDLEDRLSAIALVKVGFEDERLQRFSDGAKPDQVNHDAAVDVEAQKYLKVANDYATNRDLCTLIQEDFARKLKQDVETYRFTERKAMILAENPGEPMLMQRSPARPAQNKNLLALMGVSLVGTGVLAAIYLRRNRVTR